MSARRGRGEGSLHYDADRGRWVAVIDLGTDPDTGKRRRRKAVANSKTEARARLDEMRAELRRTGTLGRGDYTVAHCVADLLAVPPASWRSPITLRLGQQHASRIIRAIGTVPLVKLTPRQVRAMLGTMADAGMAGSTIGQVRSFLRLAIRRAERDGLVGRNVADLAELPAGTRRQSRSLTLDQIAALLAQPMTPWWSAYLLVGIGCGLRPGELQGLTWPDIDLEAGVLLVRRALHEETPAQPGPHRLVLAELKSPSSRRTLRMPEATVAALKTHKAAQAARRLKAGARWQDQQLVFAGPSGRPLWPAGLRASFRRLCKRAGLGSDWHLHEQRHTFVSVLSDAGESIESIAAAVGHKSPAITRSVYWHAISPCITSAAIAMDGILGTSGTPPEDRT
jgi:integrase